jgi:uncharacterized membrane protein YphA (DoxX/SURF4 family)
VQTRRWQGWALFALRVALGLKFLQEAAGQLAEGWIGGSQLEAMLQKAVAHNPELPPYRSFLEDVVIPHADVFTDLVVLGELAVGVGLVLGLLTRLSALAAIFLNLNFLLMFGPARGWFDALFIILEAVIVVFGSRQALSVDGLLARHGLAPPFLSAPASPRSAGRLLSRSG